MGKLQNRMAGIIATIGIGAMGFLGYVQLKHDYEYFSSKEDFPWIYQTADKCNQLNEKAWTLIEEPSENLELATFLVKLDWCNYDRIPKNFLDFERDITLLEELIKKSEKQ